MMTKETLKKLISYYFGPNDEWLDSHRIKNPVWTAKVSYKDIVFDIVDDNGRPGTKVNSWTRLKALVENSDLILEEFNIHWRKRKQFIVNRPPLFFFARSIVGMTTWTQNFHFYLTGTPENDIMVVQKWSLPLLEKVGVEQRHISQIDPEFILWNTSMNPDTPTTKYEQMDT